MCITYRVAQHFLLLHWSKIPYWSLYLWIFLVMNVWPVYLVSLLKDHIYTLLGCRCTEDAYLLWMYHLLGFGFYFICLWQSYCNKYKVGIAVCRYSRHDKRSKLPGWILSHLRDANLNLSTDMALHIAREVCPHSCGLKFL
jgi:hypothetical protein